MSRRNRINGALVKFLNGYTSLNTRYGSDWLFGHVVEGSLPLDIDLLSPEGGGGSAIEVVNALAVQLFEDQSRKAGLDPSAIKMASLGISRSNDHVDRRIYEIPVTGYLVKFRVQATAPTGRRGFVERIVFVAPQEAITEFRRVLTERMRNRY